MAEVPLRACELDTIPLERGRARAAVTQLLALRDENADAQRQRFHARAVTAPSETGRPQVPQ